MNCITIEFEGEEDQIQNFLPEMKKFQEFWSRHGVEFSLYQDTNRKTRFLGLFFTEKSVEEVAGLLQSDPQAKTLFDQLREAEISIVLSVLQEVK